MKLSSKLVSDLLNAGRIAALTGAGISADSGVPTFREAQSGLWAKFDPMELATPRAFMLHPDLVWSWYTWRKNLIAKARPNPAHFALAELEKARPSFRLITQNVDNLHQEAGSKIVIELHGNIFRTRCSEENVEIKTWKEAGDAVPTCPDCGGNLRPDVVWFNEMMPQQALAEALDSARMSDLFLIIGTSALVQPAASLPLHAKANGAILIEVNPKPTPISASADHVFRDSAGKVVPELVAHILGKRR